jgi:hypothetical protein
LRTIVNYIKEWLIEIDKRVLFLTTFFTAMIIFLNYRFNLDSYISSKNSFGYSLAGRYVIFYLAFVIPYLLFRFICKKPYPANNVFLFLLFFSPALFALKAALNIPLDFSNDVNWNYYWNAVLYWPVLLLIVGLILYLVWLAFDTHQPFYGLSVKKLNWKPYLLMLLIMLPLIAAASTQQDFLFVYPKLNAITQLDEKLSWWHKLVFELSYSSDFFSIELFFRGFLVLAFVKWTGKDAILPMACFYCTIHFGKPLGECISSYFGGILLGIIVYNTRSIYGGLIVHLGIAWLMELGGYIGNAASS